MTYTGAAYATARQPVDRGLGRVCDEAGRPLGALRVTGTSQKHGVLGGGRGAEGVRLQGWALTARTRKI